MLIKLNYKLLADLKVFVFSLEVCIELFLQLIFAAGTEVVSALRIAFAVVPGRWLQAFSASIANKKSAVSHLLLCILQLYQVTLRACQGLLWWRFLAIRLLRRANQNRAVLLPFINQPDLLLYIPVTARCTHNLLQFL